MQIATCLRRIFIATACAMLPLAASAITRVVATVHNGHAANAVDEPRV